MYQRSKPHPFVIFLMFVFALVGLALMFMVNTASAQQLQCDPIGAGAAKIVLEVVGDPLSPYIAENPEPAVWQDPEPYVVLTADGNEPPRYWLSPRAFLYRFVRVDYNGWGYSLIQDDPYTRQPSRAEFEREHSEWDRFNNPEAISAFQAMTLTSAYESWWSDDAYDAPIDEKIVAWWYIYDDAGEELEYGMVYGSDDGQLLYPARWTDERFDEPYPEDGFKHPVCWDSMSLDALDEFKFLVLEQRAAWESAH